MRKIIGCIFAFIGLAIVISACSGDTYAKKLDKEKKAIERFIKEEGITVIDYYPVNRGFKEKEYFKDPKTGIYLHVIDSGVGEKAKKFVAGGSQGGTSVDMRYADTRFLGDTAVWKNNGPDDGLYGLSLTYGNTGSYTFAYSTSYKDILFYTFLSPACAFPLQYVRDGAVVSMIVPFSQGSTQQTNDYSTIYYGYLKYTFAD
ncbi:DUF4827 family protein [Dysgonomonas sp. ZJ279]|uniref:DUF4827 family protein n=1 Tax=Dysgonomonas sp. ZJ279 TaxID=2709796 RepID=UPI0013EA0473|nr:DUF4827 family protein [Dysgonomonas sp. ZJ279]